MEYHTKEADVKFLYASMTFGTDRYVQLRIVTVVFVRGSSGAFRR